MNNKDAELLMALDIEDLETLYDNVYDVASACDDMLSNDSIRETIINKNKLLKSITELDDNMYDFERVFYAASDADAYKDEGRFTNELMEAYDEIYKSITIWDNEGMPLDSYSVVQIDLKDGLDKLNKILDFIASVKGENDYE